MNYNYNEIQFASSDGKNTVFAEIYTPKIRSAKAVIQLSHGMIDYVTRYEGLADYLTGQGYIFAGNHHLGHGKTAASDDDLGYFAEDGGITFLLKDLHAMNRYLRSEFPALPVVMLGHSMGSFLARLYAEKYSNSIAGLIIHGTSGPNRLMPIGRMLACAKKASKGGRYRSGTVATLAFGGYNSHCTPEEGEWAWLSRDNARIAGRSSDKFTSFTFTLAGYIDLFNMLGRCNSPEWFASYPKDMPTLIMSGADDPVGAYGKGPTYVYKHLLIERCSNVTLKLYEGARHELFNETNREEVFADLVGWLDGAIR